MRWGQLWEEHRKGVADLGGSRCVSTAVRESWCTGASTGGRVAGAACSREGEAEMEARERGHGLEYTRPWQRLWDLVKESWGVSKVYLFNLLF